MGDGDMVWGVAQDVGTGETGLTWKIFVTFKSP